jgi:uncharacterized protein YlxW (UPF0749 family)
MLVLGLSFALCLTGALLAATQNGRGGGSQDTGRNQNNENRPRGGRKFAYLKAQIDALQTTVSSQALQIAALESNFEQTTARIDEQAADIQSLFAADQALGTLILGLQGVADDLTARIAAAEQNVTGLQTSVGTLETDVGTLQTDLTSLHAQLDATNAAIAALAPEVTAMRNALSAGCPTGSSIRKVSGGIVTCQPDTIGTLSVITQAGTTVNVPAFKAIVNDVTCPSNTTIVSGGFQQTTPASGGPFLVQYQSFPLVVSSTGTTGWRVGAYNPSGSSALNMLGWARCAVIVP